jgi:hypothetical protein
MDEPSDPRGRRARPLVGNGCRVGSNLVGLCSRQGELMTPPQEIRFDDSIRVGVGHFFVLVAFVSPDTENLSFVPSLIVALTQDAPLHLFEWIFEEREGVCTLGQ